MGEAQLIELKEHSSGDQQNAPEAMLALHDVGNTRANQKQRPESPQPVDGDVPHVVEEEGDSAENEKGAPKESAAASAAHVNADHDWVAALSVRVHLLAHARMKLAGDLVVETIANFLRIEIVFVAHKLLLLFLGPMVRFSLRISALRIGRASPRLVSREPPSEDVTQKKRPARIRISGQNDTKNC